MKYSFLTAKPAIVVTGLILGLYIGFKISNTQYRLGVERALNQTIAGVSAAGAPGADQTRQQVDRARQNPQDVEAQLDAADQMIQTGRPEEALPFLEQANRINGQDSRTLAGLGMSNFMLGNYDQAIKWASQSLAITPENPGSTFLLIASYIRTGQKLDEAERLLTQLEGRGIDPTTIAQVRGELATARTKTPAGPRSVLDHGPSEKPPTP
jgi:tetratricopeptide (TPR) repeat protein